MKRKAEKSKYLIPNRHRKLRRKSYTNSLLNPHIPSPQPTALTKPAALWFRLSNMRKMEPPRLVLIIQLELVIPGWVACGNAPSRSECVHHRSASPSPSISVVTLLARSATSAPYWKTHTLAVRTSPPLIRKKISPAQKGRSNTLKGAALFVPSLHGVCWQARCNSGEKEP